MSKYDPKEEKASVNGDHPNSDLLKILNKFIDIYVLCPCCGLPETSLVLKHKKDLYHHCDACGSETEIPSDNRMSIVMQSFLTSRQVHHKRHYQVEVETEVETKVSP